MYAILSKESMLGFFMLFVRQAFVFRVALVQLILEDTSSLL